ncbi:MAG: Crp/Fnr family transcriptional regulator [Deltaproteobacteria bacterium]|nr:Crp/Fnr family transcriptional regulator [Deltaproteobacteria bacterium]
MRNTLPELPKKSKHAAAMPGDSLCLLCRCRIKENTLFSDLTDEQLDIFKDAVTTSFYKKKDVIFVEGGPCPGFYVVKSGRVKLIKTSKDGKEQIIKILQPGELLGMETFYNGKSYANTAMAMDDCELCFIEKGAFFRIIGEHPSIAKKIIVALSKELDHAYSKIGSMGLMNAREKMAHLLNTLASEYGIKENGRIQLNLSLSRLEIAELLGITQETAIRLLKGFKDDGIIEIKRKEIIIKSPAKLEALGE